MVEIQEVQLINKPSKTQKKSSCLVKTCLGCGTKFLARSHHQKYCSKACRIEHNNKPKTKGFDTKMVKINGVWVWVRNGEILDS